MLKFLIKKLANARKANRLAKENQLRAKHNWEQAQLMYDALGQRD